MNSEVDQFGRSTNSSDGLNDDKSKRILEALSDIKNQLQNDEFIPKVEKENISKTKDIKKDTNHDLDFKTLHYKIESLEKKINQIVENLQNNQKGGLKLKKEEELEEEDQSIFHKIENHNSDQKQSKSIIVLENQNLQNISSFKFYHFLILLFILLVVLALIISNNLGLTISESLNFYLSLFS